MEKRAFVEAAIRYAHQATLDGRLEWRLDRNRMSATLAEPIMVVFEFKDFGVDAAEWHQVNVAHPVGGGLTMVSRSGSAMERLCDLVAAGPLLQQLEEIFERVLLAPRREKAAEVMARIAAD